MRLRSARWLLLALACLIAAFPYAARAETRLALVIGNSDYQHTSPLANPRNDALLMTASLKQVGFSVTTLLDADQVAMKRALVDFGRSLRGSDAVGLFYYAGHGVEAKGENYLVPVDANIADEAEVPIATVNLNEFLATMERAQSRVNVVILDACRDNPFPGASRSGSRGLAAVDAPSGTYIAFATGPRQVALDGTGANSPYTRALAEAIGVAGIPVEEVFKRTRRAVQKETQKQQTPWETSSIIGDFFFIPPADGAAAATVPATSAPAADSSVEITFWNSIKDSDRPEPFESYLAQYPDGAFAALARLKLDEVRDRMQPAGGQAALLPKELFPQSSIAIVSETELVGLSCDQLWVARNEIFARNGYCFQTPRGQAYFGNLNCYATSQDILSPLETENVGLIRAWETRKACR